MPAPSPALAAAIRETRAALNLNDIPSSWTYEQRIVYNKALAARIQSNPTEFAPENLAAAEAVARANYRPLETFGVADAAGVFFGEFVNQAQDINPFSERNRTKTGVLLFLLGALAVYVFTRRAAPAQ